VIAAVTLCLGVAAFAARQQQQTQTNVTAPKGTKLLWREDFKSPKPISGAQDAFVQNQFQFTQDAIANPNLELKLYGPGGKPGTGNESGLLLSNESDPSDPGTVLSILWSGVSQGPWGVLLRDKNNYLDLRDTARIRWRIRPRSFHQLRPVIKLADGTLLVGDYTEPDSTYFAVMEVYLLDVPRWRILDPKTMAESRLKTGEPLWHDVDLSKVDEVGFTDLMGGAGHGAFGGNVAVDWMEVYGNPVKR
jgi:hypothetical protein